MEPVHRIQLVGTACFLPKALAASSAFFDVHTARARRSAETADLNTVQPVSEPTVAGNTVKLCRWRSYIVVIHVFLSTHSPTPPRRIYGI